MKYCNPATRVYRITVRVVGIPSANFDGTTTATFAAKAFSTPRQGEEQGSITALIEPSTTGGIEADDDGDASTTFLTATYSGDVDSRLQQTMDVTFYHCRPGSFWNVTLNDKYFSTCQLCTTIEGESEVSA